MVLGSVRSEVERNGGRKYLVAFNEREIHGFGDELCNGALSTTCGAGDQPDMMVT
jgi:hypothetical protein